MSRVFVWIGIGFVVLVVLSALGGYKAGKPDRWSPGAKGQYFEASEHDLDSIREDGAIEQRHRGALEDLRTH